MYLELNITPDAIPVSGEWLVRTYLFSVQNNTRTAVDSTVTMLETLTDGSVVRESRITRDGQTSFNVYENVVAVSFQATSGELSVSNDIAGPHVLSSSLFWPIMFATLSLTVTYIGWAIKFSLDVREVEDSRRVRLLTYLAPFSALPPVSYLVLEVPKWVPSGYYPVMWLNLLIYYFPIIPILMWIASYIILLLSRRGSGNAARRKGQRSTAPLCTILAPGVSLRER